MVATLSSHPPLPEGRRGLPSDSGPSPHLIPSSVGSADPGALAGSLTKGMAVRLCILWRGVETWDKVERAVHVECGTAGGRGHADRTSKSHSGQTGPT